MATVAQIIKDLDGVLPDGRTGLIKPLVEKLTHFSEGTLFDFQSTWDFSRPFSEYAAAQNQVLKECVDLECSEFGAVVRAALGLEPLTLETEINT